jgi:hypothetical protein
MATFVLMRGGMHWLPVARVPENVSRLVYLDTIVPRDGESWMDLLGQEVATPPLRTAELEGDGCSPAPLADYPRSLLGYWWHCPARD